ncbi:MAG: Tim44 domain-containing protein [Rubrivivax sp.]|nr:Tim44 domain-containing protein [Rubrivivax sp.]
MKHWMTVSLALAVAFTALPDVADAKRLGGGKSTGVQRNMPARTAPDAPPAKPATPAQAGQPANAQSAAPAPAAAAATPPKRNWLGPIAGLAAGLGLAALLSHFGLGEAFASTLMLLLLAGAAAFLLMFLWRRFGPQATRAPALASAGGPNVDWQPNRRSDPVMERSAPAAAAATGAGPGITRAFVPAAFDSEGFARTAKTIFIRLQAAHDSADLDDLRRFTTPEMFASLRVDIQERGPAEQHTDVLNVDAAVLDIADESERQVVSVRFRGQVLEERGGTPTDFDEVWHLVKPHDGDKPWVIAGIEQMS